MFLDTQRLKGLISSKSALKEILKEFPHAESHTRWKYGSTQGMKSPENRK